MTHAFLGAGKAPVVQLNYSLIAQDAGVYRGLAQQVVSDLCYRLSMQLLSGHPVQVRTQQHVWTHGCSGCA
jgi:hypothetical protein